MYSSIQDHIGSHLISIIFLGHYNVQSLLSSHRQYFIYPSRKSPIFNLGPDSDRFPKLLQKRIYFNYNNKNFNKFVYRIECGFDKAVENPFAY